ncbi:MAG: hypothetical protein KA362_07490 [Chloroflexi bacterium]|nr:hypothetical protein [Chloroflexota bacterium]MBK6709598.1 hypothetical protein [Chloroflexota bacterium]MBK7915360.1 hypothetical protein [Chloroflexota bacterium]MBK8934150.1 hypothetical protein [Chloroflexota bacterium]MBP6803936.1 hypothetical protein [Chloroflexota bacterium]
MDQNHTRTVTRIARLDLRPFTGLLQYGHPICRRADCRPGSTATLSKAAQTVTTTRQGWRLVSSPRR